MNNLEKEVENKVELPVPPSELLHELLEQRFPQSKQMEIYKAIGKLGLKEDDSLYVFLYVMGYIKTMYEDIPVALNDATTKLGSISSEAASNLKTSLEDVINKANNDNKNLTAHLFKTQKQFIATNEETITKTEEKITTMLNKVDSDLKEKFDKMLEEQSKINNITENKAIEFDKKISSSIGKIVSDAGDGLKSTLGEQQKLNEEIKESAKIYQIGISLSNKQLAMSIEKQKIKIIEIFIDALRKELPDVVERAINEATYRIEAEKGGFSFKKFAFYASMVISSSFLTVFLLKFIH